MESIGVIGTGHVGTPMAAFCAKKGRTVWVSKRNEAHSQALAQTYDTVTIADNQKVVDMADIVVLALRPQVWRDAVEPLSFRPG